MTDLKVEIFPAENLAKWKSVWDWLLDKHPLIEATDAAPASNVVGGGTEDPSDEGGNSC